MIRTETQEARRLRRRAIKEQNKASKNSKKMNMATAIRQVLINDSKEEI